jgi:hypothetical protein
LFLRLKKDDILLGFQFGKRFNRLALRIGLFENSFGFGIWPEGNTPIRVKIEDWGVAVNREDGKARVWGFEIL